MRRKALHRLGPGGSVALFFALIFCLPMVLAGTALAETAPQYEDSEPGAGSSVQAPPGIVSVTFNEPLDDSSTLAVFNECNDQVDGGNVVVDVDEIRVDVVVRHYSGRYTVKYAAVGLGGVTGTNEGSFTFDAAEGHSCKDGDGKKKHQHGDKDKDKDKDKHQHGDDDDGSGNGHGDHNDGNDHGSGGDHDTMDHSTTDHSTMDHGATDDHDAMTAHTSSDGGHGEHDRKADGGHGKKHGDQGTGKHADHEGGGSSEGSFASGPLEQIPADGRAALIALALCAGLGVIGGAFLRTAAD